MEPDSNQIDKPEFLEEARRQSILASASHTPDEDAWLDHADTRGWK